MVHRRVLRKPDVFVYDVPVHSFNIREFEDRHSSLWGILEEEIKDSYGPCVYKGVNLEPDNGNFYRTASSGTDLQSLNLKNVAASSHLRCALEELEDDAFLNFYKIDNSKFSPRFVEAYDQSGVSRVERFRYDFDRNPKEILRLLLTFQLPRQKTRFLSRITKELSIFSKPEKDIA